MPSISVIVPTYRRPDRLRRCLAAIEAQSRPPAEVLVVCRREDADGRAVAAASGVAEVIVEQSGVLAAMDAGARAASGEVIAFVDDDAELFPDWIERAEGHLADSAVGGLCGRDIVDDDETLPRRADVGLLTRWGKLVGNHHVATGPARRVDILKGANMALRREALALPVGLRGAGAQVHYEIATCLWATASGWELVMDPAMAALHLAGSRHDDDARGARSAAATANAAYNLVLAIGSQRPRLRRRLLAYGVLVGDRDAPGLLRGAVALVQGDRVVRCRVVPALRGRLAAHAALRRGAGADMLTY